MGRKKAAPAGRATLTREERRALKHHHINQIQEALAELEEVREPFKEAQAEVTRRFRLAKADGFERKRLERILTDLKSKGRDLLKEEFDRLEDQDDFGLPSPSNQPDLFDTLRGESKLPTAAQDEIYWSAEGYRAGLQAGERNPPAECGPEFHQAYMEHYDRGQAFRGEQFIKANELIAKRGQPDAEMKPVDLNGADDEQQLDIEAEAKRLANSDFMDTSDAEEGAEEEPGRPKLTLVH